MTDTADALARLTGLGLAHPHPAAGLSAEGLQTLGDLLTIAALQGAGAADVEARALAGACSTALTALSVKVDQMQGHPTSLAPIIEQARHTIETCRT